MSIREIFEKLVASRLNKHSKYMNFRKKRKDLTFSFWWWVGKNIQSRKEFGFICTKLYDFYSQKFNNLVSLGISEIVVLNNTIYICLFRPGLLIGKMGSNIDSLTEVINSDVNGRKISDYKISIIEDNASWWKEVVSVMHYREYEY